MDLIGFSADSAFFSTNIPDFDPSEYRWGFTCYSRQNYKDNIPLDFVDEVTYGIYYDEDGYGCLMEVTMLWESIKGKATPFLRVFSESFLLLSCPTQQKITQELAAKKDYYFTSEDFSRLLISHGFMDWSNNHLLDTKE